MPYKNIEDYKKWRTKYLLKNKEKINKYYYKYRLNNKKKIKQYYLNNSENLKLYLLKNKYIIKKRNRLYRLKNKEKIKEYSIKYNLKNPHFQKFINAKRRASKLKATPKFANLNKIKEIYKNCPKGYVVDHIIPLQGKIVCGLHVEWNLQYLTKSENSSKSNTFVW